MADYDPAILRSFAHSLYQQAMTTVIVTSLFVALAGGAGGYCIGQVYSTPGDSGGSTMGSLLGVLLGAALGYVIGQTQALKLKLAAQTLLCQVEIEANTRRSAAALKGLGSSQTPHLQMSGR